MRKPKADDGKWMKQPLKFPGKMTGAKGSDVCECHTLAREAFGFKGEEFATDEADERAGLASFAYLWRRFGPPLSGSDSHKEIANYVLTTKMEGVFLNVSPNASGLSYGVGYLATRELEYETMKPWYEYWKKAAAWCKKNGVNMYGKEQPWVKVIGKCPRRNDPREWRKLKGPIHDINKALFEACRELLRPVWCRDVAINVLGRMKDGDAQGTAAEPSEFAGLGVPYQAMVDLKKS